PRPRTWMSPKSRNCSIRNSTNECVELVQDKASPARKGLSLVRLFLQLLDRNDHVNRVAVRDFLAVLIGHHGRGVSDLAADAGGAGLADHDAFGNRPQIFDPQI